MELGVPKSSKTKVIDLFGSEELFTKKLNLQMGPFP